MTTIRVEGVEKLLKKIDTLAKMRNVLNAISAAATDLQVRLQEYPPQSSRPNPLIRTNAKVRRGFFYYLKAGKIQVPYRRKMALHKRWGIALKNGGWRAIVGNSTSYARLVQDSAKQTNYHRQTGWITTDEIVKRYGNQTINSIRQAIIKEVNSG